MIAHRIATCFPLVALLLLTSTGVVGAQSTSNWPTRNIVLKGGQYLTDKYIDVGPFSIPVLPLDDVGACENRVDLVGT